MKYYIIKNSDNIVLRTDVSSVDPVATQKKASFDLLSDKNFMTLIESSKKLNSILKTSKVNSGTYLKTSSLIKSNNNDISDYMSKYMSGNPIYTTPAPIDGVAIEVDSEKFENCNSMLSGSSGNYVFIDDELNLGYIENNVGKKYFYKDENEEWQSYVCESLSEEIPSEWICVCDITDDQKTEIKLQSETPEDTASRIYNEKFSEFITRIFLESPEFSEYESIIESVSTKTNNGNDK